MQRADICVRLKIYVEKLQMLYVTNLARLLCHLPFCHLPHGTRMNSTVYSMLQKKQPKCHSELMFIPQRLN